MIPMKKTVVASGIALALGTANVYAAGVNDLFGNNSFTTTSANFTMLTGTGGTQGGTNNVVMTWDGDAFTDSSDYTGPGSYSNVTAASTSKFSSHLWTAHDIQVFTPGSYSFDTSLGGGVAETAIMGVTVPTGQVGMHMLFDWNANLNIDVFVVAAPSSVYGAGVLRGGTQAGASTCDSAGVINCLWNAGGVTGFLPTDNEVWMLATVDGNGDTFMGIPMVAGGPFAEFNAGFNATMSPIADISDIPTSPVPVPAAVWLFGSGLLGMVGVARRKAKQG
jgi:hypothetical protein